MMIKKIVFGTVAVIIFCIAVFYGYNQGVDKPKTDEIKTETVKSFEKINSELLEKYQAIGLNAVDFSVYNKEIEIFVNCNEFIDRTKFKEVAKEIATQVRVDRKIDSKMKIEFNINTGKETITYSGAF